MRCSVPERVRRDTRSDKRGKHRLSSRLPDGTPLITPPHLSPHTIPFTPIPPHLPAGPSSRAAREPQSGSHTRPQSGREIPCRGGLGRGVGGIQVLQVNQWHNNNYKNSSINFMLITTTPSITPGRRPVCVATSYDRGSPRFPTKPGAPPLHAPANSSDLCVDGHDGVHIALHRVGDHGGVEQPQLHLLAGSGTGTCLQGRGAGEDSDTLGWEGQGGAGQGRTAILWGCARGTAVPYPSYVSLREQGEWRVRGPLHKGKRRVRADPSSRTALSPVPLTLPGWLSPGRLTFPGLQSPLVHSPSPS